VRVKHSLFDRFFLLALTVLEKKKGRDVKSAFIPHFSVAFQIHKTISKCIVVDESVCILVRGFQL
jgi:hypothetical protein